MPFWASVLASRPSKDLPPDSYSYKLAGDGAGAHYGLDMIVVAEPEVDEKRMSVRLPYADGNSRDGVGDLLEVGGIDFSRHQANPISLFDHGKQIVLPIGTVRDPETGEYKSEVDIVNKTATDTVFFYQGKKPLPNADKGKNYDHAIFCEQVFDLWCNKFIRGGSIGYQVMRAQQLAPDYESGTPQGLHLVKTKKLESSIVVMPANQKTVAKMFPWYGDEVRRLLSCPGGVCGKQLSPYLVKSLSPFASEAKAQLGWEPGRGNLSGKALPKNDVDGALAKIGAELEKHEDPAPMPGYGQIFINSSDVGGHEAEVWYVGGDGDEDGFGKIVEAKVREAFPAVSKITYEAESFPPKDAGWRQVYPRRKPWGKKSMAGHECECGGKCASCSSTALGGEMDAFKEDSESLDTARAHVKSDTSRAYHQGHLRGTLERTEREQDSGGSNIYSPKDEPENHERYLLGYREGRAGKPLRTTRVGDKDVKDGVLTAKEDGAVDESIGGAPDYDNPMTTTHIPMPAYRQAPLMARHKYRVKRLGKSSKVTMIKPASGPKPEWMGGHTEPPHSLPAGPTGKPDWMRDDDQGSIESAPGPEDRYVRPARAADGKAIRPAKPPAYRSPIMDEGYSPEEQGVGGRRAHHDPKAGQRVPHQPTNTAAVTPAPQVVNYSSSAPPPRRVKQAPVMGGGTPDEWRDPTAGVRGRYRMKRLEGASFKSHEGPWAIEHSGPWGRRLTETEEGVAVYPTRDDAEAGVRRYQTTQRTSNIPGRFRAVPHVPKPRLAGGKSAEFVGDEAWMQEEAGEHGSPRAANVRSKYRGKGLTDELPDKTGRERASLSNETLANSPMGSEVPVGKLDKKAVSTGKPPRGGTGVPKQRHATATPQASRNTRERVAEILAGDSNVAGRRFPQGRKSQGLPPNYEDMTEGSGDVGAGSLTGLEDQTTSEEALARNQQGRKDLLSAVSVRKRYRGVARTPATDAKTAVRMLRKGEDSRGLVYMKVQDLRKAQAMAGRMGLTFEHRGFRRGHAKVHVSGNNGMIRAFAGEHGVTLPPLAQKVGEMGVKDSKAMPPGNRSDRTGLAVSNTSTGNAVSDRKVSQVPYVGRQQDAMMKQRMTRNKYRRKGLVDQIPDDSYREREGLSYDTQANSPLGSEVKKGGSNA